MSFPPGTEMFQFTGFASRPYVFSSGYPCGVGCPIRKSPDQTCSHLPRAFRSVPRPSSPLSAKASTRCPYLRLIPQNPRAQRTSSARDKTRSRTGCKHCLGRRPSMRPHMKTLHRIRHSLAARAYPPRSHDKLLFTLQTTPPPGSPRTVSLVFSKRRHFAISDIGCSRNTWCSVARKLCCGRGGGERDRTDDLLLAKQALSQLSYAPVSEDR